VPRFLGHRFAKFLTYRNHGKITPRDNTKTFGDRESGLTLLCYLQWPYARAILQAARWAE